MPAAQASAMSSMRPGARPRWISGYPGARCAPASPASTEEDPPLTKTELITAVADKGGLSKSQATQAVEAMLAAMTEALAQGDPISLPGFGSFAVRARAARQGRNPHSGEAITIAASKYPAFKPGKGLRDVLNG
jgi:DNA-binding protein HU-beta